MEQEDIIVFILEYYKSHFPESVNRETVLSELHKKQHRVLESLFRKSMDYLLLCNSLKETGIRDVYLYNEIEAEGELSRYKAYQKNRDYVDSLAKKTQRRKDWKERNWVLAKAIDSLISTGTTLVIGAVIGLIAGYYIGATKKTENTQPQTLIIDLRSNYIDSSKRK